MSRQGRGGSPRLYLPAPGIVRPEDKLSEITVDLWLYGSLARYGGDKDERSFANLKIHLPEGSTLADLLNSINMAAEERGITFINGQLSAMPGLKPDLNHILNGGDRVGFFDPKSMWPFQYRHGVAETEEMVRAMAAERDGGLHHSYEKTGK